MPISPTSPSATARFFIDAKSLSLADDGVVRYTLVVRGSGGAENISYEGIRCETAERRLYAFGRPGGEWVRSRNDAWLRIEENAFNRQHAVLAKDYFCPPGMARPALAQIVEALVGGTLLARPDWAPCCRPPSRPPPGRSTA